MTTLDALILGIVQGLTEFLPVSSSGHLTLGKAILGISEKGILFEVIVHLGTLLAVATAFWADIVWIARGLAAWFFSNKSANADDQTDHNQAVRYFVYLAYATLPTVLIALFLKKYVENAYGSPLLAANLLLVTGTVLLISRLGLKAKGQITMKRGLAMGMAQAFAILPGISRSGTTIATGMLFGLEREQAARFSFLMAVPAIGGAFVLQMSEMIGSNIPHIPYGPLIVGFVVSYISGYFAIRVLLSLVKKGRFDYFAWYCYAVGLFGIYFFTS